MTNLNIVSDNWTIVNQNLREKSLAENIYFSDYDWNTELNDDDVPAVRAFKTAFVDTFGYDPQVIGATTYDSMHILAKAIDAVGDQDPVAVGEWITTELGTYQGAGGTISFDSDCEGARDVVVRQVKDGEFVAID